MRLFPVLRIKICLFAEQTPDRLFLLLPQLRYERVIIPAIKIAGPERAAGLRPYFSYICLQPENLKAMIGALDDQSMDEILEKNFIGRIGYADKGKIYVVPINYFYTGKYILAHSREGEKIEILRRNPDVCFEVDEIHDLANWRSVIIWGKYEELTDQKERYYALDLLIRQIHKLKVKAESEGRPAPFSVNEESVMPDKLKSIVYRIQPQERSGRFELSRKGAKGDHG